MDLPPRLEEAAPLPPASAIFGHRMSLWLYASIVGLVLLFFFARHMVGVVGFKVVLLTVAGYLGYWISRALERGQRPHQLLEEAAKLRSTLDSLQPHVADDLGAGWGALANQLEARADALSLRRTIIVAACLVASALGG